MTMTIIRIKGDKPILWLSE